MNDNIAIVLEFHLIRPASKTESLLFSQISNSEKRPRKVNIKRDIPYFQEKIKYYLFMIMFWIKIAVIKLSDMYLLRFF